MSYRITLTDDQLDFIIEECKNDLEFSDWFSSKTFTTKDAKILESIVTLLAKCLEIKEKTNA